MPPAWSTMQIRSIRALRSCAPVRPRRCPRPRRARRCRLHRSRPATGSSRNRAKARRIRRSRMSARPGTQRYSLDMTPVSKLPTYSTSTNDVAPGSPIGDSVSTRFGRRRDTRCQAAHDMHIGWEQLPSSVHDESSLAIRNHCQNPRSRAGARVTSRQEYAANKPVVPCRATG